MDWRGEHGVGYAYLLVPINAETCYSVISLLQTLAYFNCQQTCGLYP